MALQSLRCGETNMSVVAGVNVLITPTLFMSLSKIGMLSPEGRCRAVAHAGTQAE